MKSITLRLVFTLLVLGSVVYGQSSTDVKQSKQIRVIVAELDRVGKKVVTISEQIKVIVAEVDRINKVSQNASGTNQEFADTKNKIEEIDNQVKELNKKIDAVYKEMANSNSILNDKIKLLKADTSGTIAKQSDLKQMRTDIDYLNRKIVKIEKLKLEQKPQPQLQVQLKSQQPEDMEYANNKRIHYSFIPNDANYRYYYSDVYSSAMKNFDEGNYKIASRQFNRIRLNKRNSLADNAQYWLGECYYAQGFYKQAIREFEKVFTFDEKDKYDDAQLKLGYCYKKLRNRARAIEEFERLIQYYPYSEYYELALRELSYLR